MNTFCRNMLPDFYVLLTVHPCIILQIPSWCTTFLVCLFLFSTCFVQLCDHHQEKLLYQCDTWYLSLCVDDAGCIPDDHPRRVTNTRCRINTVISPDDGHTVARNMSRIEIIIQEKLCTRLVLFTSCCLSKKIN